ncbi:MAG: bifunctional adenosylcobinamide kinase/adenosylcobinamide-phosphate guanylyltransferase [Alkaliphilus sp.]
MSKVIMITGGVRSGKSKYGEKLFSTDDVLYIATNYFVDDEMKKRIEIHKQFRNEKWGLLEEYKNLAIAVENREEKNIFLDCVTALITNYVFEENPDNQTLEYFDEIQNKIDSELTSLIETIRKTDKNIIFITNEVGFGLVPEHKLGRVFRDIAGNINTRIAELSDEVILMVSGIPLKIKGE